MTFNIKLTKSEKNIKISYTDKDGTKSSIKVKVKNFLWFVEMLYVHTGKIEYDPDNYLYLKYDLQVHDHGTFTGVFDSEDPDSVIYTIANLTRQSPTSFVIVGKGCDSLILNVYDTVKLIEAIDEYIGVVS
jgi:hypothetical protein